MVVRGALDGVLFINFELSYGTFHVGKTTFATNLVLVAHFPLLIFNAIEKLF